MNRDRFEALLLRYGEVYFLSYRIARMMLSDRIQPDLTHEQFYLLRSIKQHERITPSELAEITFVNRSAITAMIDRLVKKGYVRRFRDDIDRRVVFLEITEKGREIFTEVEKSLRLFVEEVSQSISAKETEAFINTYEKIANIIKDKYRSVEKA